MEIYEDLQGKMQKSHLSKGEYIISSDGNVLCNGYVDVEKKDGKTISTKKLLKSRPKRAKKTPSSSKAERPVSTKFVSTEVIDVQDITTTSKRCKNGFCGRCATPMYNSIFFSTRNVEFTLCKKCRKIMAREGTVEIDGSLFWIKVR